MINDGYSICSNAWALDKEIKNELGLLLIISSLCAEKGYCWATNDYLAGLFDESSDSISRKIKKLEEKGYVKIQYERKGTQITKRIITIDKIIGGELHHRQNCRPTIDKIVEDNNTNINNISLFINKIKEKKSEYINNGNGVKSFILATSWARQQPEYEQLTAEERRKLILEV